MTGNELVAFLQALTDEERELQVRCIHSETPYTPDESEVCDDPADGRIILLEGKESSW